ncbi:hypothetical protein BGZ72_003548 [Mortierella alpina]|nr:hypothetical protein BGZ72_003548 [Mortierella alpina]
MSEKQLREDFRAGRKVMVGKFELESEMYNIPFDTSSDEDIQRLFKIGSKIGPCIIENISAGYVTLKLVLDDSIKGMFVHYSMLLDWDPRFRKHA